MSPAQRASVVDEIFLRTHRGLGTPIALQGLWRTADRVDPELLRQVHAALRVGPLGRRVIRPRVPGARRSWRANTRAYPLELTAGTITNGELLEWAAEQGANLDPEYGPGWRLSTAALADGGSIVSLTCSHALADGRALVLAVDDALGGTSLRRPSALVRRSSSKSTAPEVDCSDAPRLVTGAPDRSNTSEPMTSPAGEADRSDARVNAAGPRAATSDWSDAWRQWSIVVRGTVRALRRGIPERPARAVADRESAVSAREHTGKMTHSVVLQCPAGDWESVAAAQGGTANSLFIALIAKMLWASGFPGEMIDASLPVDTRDEPRVDNDLSMTEITIERADTPATIREKARIAYERRMSSPGEMPEELLQVIPDRWAYALSKGAGERDILCSNLGTLPDSLRALGPHRCTGVAARAIHPGLTANRLPRTRLSGYLCHIADTYTLAVVSLDPERVGTPETLRALAHETATALGLPITLW
ncbi:hypothetical protein [Nocardia sp. NPDC049707]|uniref:hypothetical protein n=1 Tax=Nocardia sp. NPDC049707 TaxID=3154735 RepID=UPI00342B087D